MGYFTVLFISWMTSIFSRKKGVVISALAFAWMSYLAGTASPDTTLDYLSYRVTYNVVATGQMGNRMEWLYTFLSEVASRHSLDYAAFRLWIMSFGFLILFIAVLRLSESPVLFTAMFLIFPFFSEATQVRSFIAYSIVLLAVSFLREGFKLRRLIPMEGLILLAAGFHSSALIYAVLPVVFIFINKLGIVRSSSVVTIITFISSMFMFVAKSSGTVVEFIYKLLSIFGGHAVADTFASLMRLSGGRLSYFLLTIVTYTLFQAIVAVKLEKLNMLDSAAYKINSVWSIVLTSQLLIPLLLVSDQMLRFQKFGMEAMMLLLGTLLVKSPKGSKLWLAPFIILFLTANFVRYYGVMDYTRLFLESIPYIGHFNGR